MHELTNPFPGLRPFESNEAHLFFGRERHIAEIERKINVFRFVSVVGNSGSGKSSLVKAGVLPALIKDAETEWLICKMRPGKDPVKELAHALSQLDPFGDANEDTKQEVILDKLRKYSLGLVQAARPYAADNRRLLIMVDQFEELFRFNTIYDSSSAVEIAEHFVDLLLNAAQQKDVPVYIMMTLRSDYLGDCEQFMGLPEAINDGQFLVPRMNREELQLSLTGPVDVANGKISPRLVQELLNEIGNNPDQLPILQHSLMRAWEVWKKEGQIDQPLDITHYQKTGGLKKALSNHAEEAYADLKTDRQRELAAFLFKTITVKGPDNRGIRRPSSVSLVAAIANSSEKEIIEVANVFRKLGRGFIMPPDGVNLDKNSMLDISHESLMRVWERLSEWVQEEVDSSQLYQRITESALWFEQEKAGLWRDPDLQIAVDWRNKIQPNAAWASLYNDAFESAIQFIEASENEKRFAQAEKVRRRKITNAVLVGFLLALSVLSIWAVTERNNSANNAQQAIEEKTKAEEQKGIAEEQKSIAETNLLKAKKEEEKALEQQLEAERQRKIALENEEQAKVAKMRAEREYINANIARKSAEIDRELAELQKSISDTLRIISMAAEKNSKRLQMLALAQNLAIKSNLADRNTYGENVKALMALQAYSYNKQYGGREMDPEIFGALFSSYRLFQDKSEYVYRHHSQSVKSICFNPNTGDLASAGSDGKVIISVSDNPSEILRSKQTELILDNVVFSDNGSQIAITCDNYSIQIYDPNNLTTPVSLIEGIHPQDIIAIEWNGPNIITACFDNKIRMIDVATKTVTRVYEAPCRPHAIDLNHEFGTLAMGGDDGKIYITNIKEAADFEMFHDMHAGTIKCLSINKKSTKIAAGSGDGKCMIYSLVNPYESYALTGHKAGLTHVRFSPHSPFLATSSWDGTVRLYDTRHTEVPPIVFSEHDSWVMDVVFSPNGKYLASCGKDKTVRTYPVQTDILIDRLKDEIKRNLTIDEWKKLVSEDIPYEKTISKLP